MKNEVQAMLERQAKWQKSRQALSWAGKIRMAEEIRDSARKLRQTCNEPPERTKPTPT